MLTPWILLSGKASLVCSFCLYFIFSFLLNVLSGCTCWIHEHQCCFAGNGPIIILFRVKEVSPVTHQGLVLLMWLSLIPAWISNDIHHKAYDEIIYPLTKFSAAATKYWKTISNFIPRFIGHMIITQSWIEVNPCYKRGPRNICWQEICWRVWS